MVPRSSGRPSSSSQLGVRTHPLPGCILQRRLFGIHSTVAEDGQVIGPHLVAGAVSRVGDIESTAGGDRVRRVGGWRRRSVARRGSSSCPALSRTPPPASLAVLIAAAGVLPASQRAEWPTKPCASVPDTPGRGVPLVDGDVVVGVVVVVVDGATSTARPSRLSCSPTAAAQRRVVCDGAALSRLPFSSCAARTTAAPNSTIVATTSATWVRPKRDLRAGVSGGRTSGGGYGV